MKFRDWLKQVGYTQAEYGRLKGKPQQTIARYCADRIPDRQMMVTIYRDSHGAVTPNDFYDLPPLIATNDNGAAEHASAVGQTVGEIAL